MLLVLSGFGLLGCVYLLRRYYRFDPIDAGLLVNEQAINLTSQHTEYFRTYITLDDFIEAVKQYQGKQGRSGPAAEGSKNVSSGGKYS